MAKPFISLICAGFLDVNTASTIKHLSARLISIPGESNISPIPGNQFYIIYYFLSLFKLELFHHNKA